MSTKTMALAAWREMVLVDVGTRRPNGQGGDDFWQVVKDPNGQHWLIIFDDVCLSRAAEEEAVGIAVWPERRVCWCSVAGDALEVKTELKS